MKACSGEYWDPQSEEAVDLRCMIGCIDTHVDFRQKPLACDSDGPHDDDPRNRFMLGQTSLSERSYLIPDSQRPARQDGVPWFGYVVGVVY